MWIFHTPTCLPVMRISRALRCLGVLLLLGAIALPCGAEKITRHAGLATETWGDQGPGHQIWDYEFHDLLTKNLYKDGNPVYQDLELVFDICYGGGMIDWITGHGGLKGTWSASSPVPADQTSDMQWTSSIKPTPTGGSNGKPGPWKHPGLELKAFATDGSVIEEYANGYTPQYIKAIEDNPKQSVKKLHETALDKSHQKGVEKGQYASSGAAADNFTITGNAETKSRHAILYAGGGVMSVDQHVYEKAIQVLEGVGYKGTDGSIQKLFHEGPLEDPTASGVKTDDWKNATKANLEAALKAARAELLKNEGKEKLLILVEGHGGSIHETRAQKFKDGDPPIPGEGFIFDSPDDTLTLPLTADEQHWLREEIPDGSGGFLYDDPSLSRLGPPVLDFTTYAQSVSGPVGIYINDLFAGSVAMSGARGDYVITLANEFLASMDWRESGVLDWVIRFDFASPGDWFQLSTEYDYFQDGSFSSEFSHYGLGVSSALYQGQPLRVPEPSGVALLLIGTLGSIVATTRRHRPPSRR